MRPSLNGLQGEKQEEKIDVQWLCTVNSLREVSEENKLCLNNQDGGTRVHPWWIHVDVWQNQYNIVK